MKIVKFWQDYKTLLIPIFLVLVTLNFCSKMWQIEPPETTYLEQSSDEYVDNIQDGESHYYENEIKPKNNKKIINIIFIVIIIATVISYKYSKQITNALTLKRVLFKTFIYRNKQTKRVLMRIKVINNSQSSLTFFEPIIHFKKFNKVRQFKISTSLFPVTLTQGTSQEIVIDIEQFWEKIDDLKRFDYIGASIEESGGKTYRRWAKPKWLIFNS